MSVCLNHFALGWWWACGVWQSKMRHGQRTRRTKARNQQGPYEKAILFLLILPPKIKYIKQNSVFLHKVFRVGGGGGPMECGEVGCNQHRNTAGPKIDPSKVLRKNNQANDIKIILHNITIFIQLCCVLFIPFLMPFSFFSEFSTLLLSILHVPYVRKV